MKRTTLILLVSMFLLPCPAVAHQETESCRKEMLYENHNEVDPVTLSVRVISGRVIDMDRVPVPGACVGVFTLDGKIVSTTTTNDQGYFKTAPMPHGSYRLVAKFDGFCVANVPLRVVRWPLGGLLIRRRIIIHIQPVRMHHCSYGDYK